MHNVCSTTVTMSQSFQTNYQPLEGGGAVSCFSQGSGVEDHDDHSCEGQSNMFIHHVPESSKSRWNHIEDLDNFFTRVYYYHQHNGLMCMMMQQAFELVQFVFAFAFSIFLLTCIDYDILFRNKLPPKNVTNHIEKISISDVILPYDKCMANVTFGIVIVIVVASIFWFLRLGFAVMNFFYFIEIKKFFNTALGIQDGDLSNVTWDEVQQRVMEVQIEQRMCIHKESLTELDIYHRILRFQNYFIAMVNKNVIPLKYRVPFLGEVTFLTKGLHCNIELLLFWGPFAPFKNNWHLRDEYKRSERRHELAEDLGKKIFYTGIINFLLFPFILLWQILYSFFFYAEMIKREPGMLGSRRWSHYGEVYLRHFNELDHELHARLNRGYRAASQYMNIFSSPVMTVIARHIAFICGAVLIVIAALTVYDEDVIQVEHVLTVMTVLAGILTACRVFIPDENLIWCPELLLTRVLAEVHYLPDAWRGKAHTSFVRREFSQLFQYKVVHILEELLSPLITPAILCFKLQHRALDIVDFFRNFTVEVTGVGDICSFAMMDIRRHGSQTWQPDVMDDISQLPEYKLRPDVTCAGGKTELSLLHFTFTNPKWKPPLDSSAFITALRTQARKDLNALKTVQEENALLSSLNSISYGAGITALGASIMQSPWGYNGGTAQMHQSLTSRNLQGGMSRLEGPRDGSAGGILASIHREQMSQSNVQGAIDVSSLTSAPLIDPVMTPSIMSPSTYGQGMHILPQDLTAIDMGLSTLYLHELRLLNRLRGTYCEAPALSNPQPSMSQLSQGRFYQAGTSHSHGLPTEGPTVSFQIPQEKTPLLET